MPPITDNRLVNWMIPALLTGVVAALMWLATSVSDLTGSVREVIVILNDHSRRIDNLETLYFRRGP